MDATAAMLMVGTMVVILGLMYTTVMTSVFVGARYLDLKLGLCVVVPAAIAGGIWLAL